jgi:hypothetical protein
MLVKRSEDQLAQRPSSSCSGRFTQREAKSAGRAHRTEMEIATSTLPRIAFEYGQMA